jgi:hypothetical protein
MVDAFNSLETKTIADLANKVSVNGDFKGTWKGMQPHQVEEGQAADWAAAKGSFDSVSERLDQNDESLKALAYVLKETDDLQTILNTAGMNKIIRLNPNYNYQMYNITIPDGVVIYGENAKIKSLGRDKSIFYIGRPEINATLHVKLFDIQFEGVSDVVNNLACINKDRGVEVCRAMDVTVNRCSFKYFLGCGLLAYDYPGGLHHSQLNDFSDNTFEWCYFALMGGATSEFTICARNKFKLCRVAIWNQGGNWQYTDNMITYCRSAFISTGASNPVLSASTVNLGHGQVSGCIINHDGVGQTPAWSDANYQINGVDYEGIFVDGANSNIPPLFTGNTLYYTNIVYVNSAASGMDKWKLTGCVFSLNILECDTLGKLALVGCSEVSTVTKT